jgi:hypothetical protein
MAPGAPELLAEAYALPLARYKRERRTANADL